MQTEMQEIKIEIFGRVQGVRFRHFIKETADGLGIRGYTMNRSDGSVLVVGQGDKESLEEFLKVVQIGPGLAKVNGVSYFWRDRTAEYESFVIALDKGMIEDQKSSFMNLGKNLFNIRSKVPSHIAIIPDGNRRWAKENGLDIVLGHKKSASFDNIIPLLDEARGSGVKYITFWAFSTENWGRSKMEVDYLFGILLKIVRDFRTYFVKNEIRFRHFGRRDRLPGKIVTELEKTEKATKDFSKFNVQICIDYGGRDEIIRAVNKLLKSGVQEIKETDLAGYLDTTGIPDPELIIRTSGEQRTSGFMPFQSAYAELCFADVHFPDFKPENLRKAIDEFAQRGRRFGK